MATSQMNEVIQHLRRAVLLHEGAGLTDGQLLEDYISRRDQAALAALVRRHGPMVWGVCRRVLRNHHDAEDAFQATFLVLVRKAASIVPRQMVANWLYGVARQTALNARATAAKRKERERQVVEMPEPAVTEQDLWRDLQPLLDEELSRLPDKYRVVIVLCDLEGKTRKEAARQLGVPEGTVAGWVARARTMLAKRLTQRGVALSGGALAALLSEKVASAGVPTSVVSSTIKAASLFAAGQVAATGAISAKVAALTEGVVKAMFVTKMKRLLAGLLLAIALSGGAGLIYQSQAAERPHGQSGPDKSISDKDATERSEEKKPVTVTDLSVELLANKDVKFASLKAAMSAVEKSEGVKANVSLSVQEAEGISARIDASAELPYSKLFQVMEALKKAGVAPITIVTEKGDAVMQGDQTLDGLWDTLVTAIKRGNETILVLKRVQPQPDQQVEKDAPATPAEKTSPKNAKKEPDVLTPEEAIKQRDKEKVTVQFKVASVEATLLSGAIAEGSQISRLQVRLKDGNNFSVRVTGRVTYWIERLGIDPAKHFSDKTVRVTGRVQHVESAGAFQIVVDDLNQIEVVR